MENVMINSGKKINKLDVLDHGFVRLVESMGSDLSVVRNARVSYDADWRAGENEGSDKRLIKYLYRHGHNTPFESVIFTFDVKLPIFVARQWMRHRTWSYNEISARYKELPEEYYVPDPSVIGVQSKDNKQMRLIDCENYDAWSSAELIDIQCKQSFEAYRQLIEDDVPRELARIVLPVGTYTHMFATVNLNNLFKFIKERQHEHAQYEIRVYAEAMLELIKPVAPVCVEAFQESLS